MRREYVGLTETNKARTRVDGWVGGGGRSTLRQVLLAGCQVGHPFDFKMHDCMFTESSMEYAEEIVSRVIRGTNRQGREGGDEGPIQALTCRCLLHGWCVCLLAAGVRQGLHDRRQVREACQGRHLPRARTQLGGGGGMGKVCCLAVP